MTPSEMGRRGAAVTNARLTKAQRSANAKKAAQSRWQRYITPTPAERRSVAGKVGHAIRTGKLIRPSICSKCDSGLNIQAHHDDYRYPLKVRWLCHWCHVGFHKRRKAIRAAKQRKS